ncbi:alpha/beta-hydrolase [Cadophora sp. DSE1049]|nr:alpha/beta-hydrolase [Cadophora sp. DSE1049]
MASSDIADDFVLKPELHAPDVFPDPLIIPPQLEHRQSIIILHGRGSFAAKFTPPLLSTGATGSEETLQTAFPHAKLIFPTASRTRATIYKRSYTHQWFDNWHLEMHTERQDLMTKGLRKSVLYIHSLLRQEIEVVRAENVVLWGLSQGCATTLTTLLTWDGKPFAAAVGMCGWLPFANVMVDMLEEDQSNDDLSHGYDDGDDPFADLEDEHDDPIAFQDPSIQHDPGAASALSAVNFLREELDLKGTKLPTFREVPIFLGHGTEDDKVKIELGRESQKCLQLLEANVQMVEYEGLGHWYSEDMFQEIFQFLNHALEGETPKQ